VDGPNRSRRMTRPSRPVDVAGSARTQLLRRSAGALVGYTQMPPSRSASRNTRAPGSHVRNGPATPSGQMEGR